jgi:hypothetical protein
MANLFKVRLNKTTENFEELFDLAFHDIYALSKKIHDSEHRAVKNYLYYIADESWMVLDEDTITLEIDGYVEISKDDAKDCDQIEYDFGKRSPTDDAFLFAIMSIFYHYLPETEFYDEVKPYQDSFDNGVILARLVNDKVKNPFMDECVSVEKLNVRDGIKKVYHALSHDVSRKAVRFYD